MIIQTFKNAFDFLVFTSIYIALVAVGMVYQVTYLLGVPASFAFYGFVFFGTVCSYNFHWLFTPHHLPPDASAKLIWHRSYKKLHLFLSSFALILALYFAILLRHHWFWLLVSALFTFLYSAPKIPVFPFTGLRKIAYGKTVFLALAWMHITTMLPLLVADVVWPMPYYLFALNRFFLIYAICILFDLRDRDRDREEGIKSMITQMNLQQVFIIYFGILLFYFVTTTWLSFYITLGQTVALLVPGLLLAFFYNRFKKQTSDYLFYFGLDGLMLFSLLLMLIFQF